MSTYAQIELRYLRKTETMQVFHTIHDIRKALKQYQEEGKSIGFIPTMGALHQGHISLIQRSTQQNDITVCSIFVNPIQFNNPNDLTSYPRKLNEDAGMLSEAGCDFIFAPEVDEMYPEPDQTIFDFGNLDKVMEGAFRPGHFRGVAIVVNKLLHIIAPQRAYFGEKDFQQLTIIRKLVETHNLPVEIIGCPIIREDDGLAMSSRNTLLTVQQRAIAPFIRQTLLKASNMAPTHTPEQITHWITDTFQENPDFILEYFQIVDQSTLEPATSWNSPGQIGCIATYLGKIRLIDNILFNIS